MLISCGKEQPEPVIPVGTDIQVNVSVKSSGVEVVPGASTYTTPAGAQFKVDLLKFYLSNFRLVKSDGSVFDAGTYRLIDFADADSKSFHLPKCPAGTYSSIRFMLGVDPNANHTLQNSEPDLDPSKGMVWSWSTGYIFFKHEGSYIDSTGAQQALLYHYGKDIAAVEVEIPFVNNLTFESGKMFQFDLKFDLGAAYSSPQVISFYQYHNNQSLTQADNPWIEALKTNFAQAFNIDVK
ncbi:MAG: MbnP family protein [Bacteroidia bacterium]